MSVRLAGLTKRFGGHAVVSDLSTEFRSGRISVLLGASGCGKTTTLRCIAGLETPDEGSIVIDGDPVFDRHAGIDLPPERRDLAMVFQSYAIWPHMTVAGNVAVPLKARRVDRSQRERLVRRALEIVGLDGFEERLATQLSGGQQQRVALARSIVRPSRVILMDEPLSNLDARLRIATRRELKELQRALGSTMVFVTHDQEEAMSLADELFVFHDGRIAQHGTPQDLYRLPTSRYVAEFLGKAAFVPVAAIPIGNGRVELRADAGLAIATVPDERLVADPERRTCVVRPEAWRIVRSEPRGFEARIIDVTFLGDREELTVDTLVGRFVVTAPGSTQARAGDEIRLEADPELVHLLPKGQ